MTIEKIKHAQWQPTEALIEGLLNHIGENDELVLTNKVLKCEGNAVLCDEISIEALYPVMEFHAKQNGKTLFIMTVRVIEGEKVHLRGLDLRIETNIIY